MNVTRVVVVLPSTIMREPPVPLYICGTLLYWLGSVDHTPGFGVGSDTYG